MGPNGSETLIPNVMEEQESVLAHSKAVVVSVSLSVWAGVGA